MHYKAILFDLDGTLIDTIPLWQRAYLETLRAEGADMELDEFMQKVYFGNTHYNTIFEKFGFPEAEWERIREDRDNRYCDLLRTQAVWMPEAENMLEKVRAALPIGMMTGSWKMYVDALDEHLNIYDKFAATVTCDDTQGGRSKPHPYGLELLAKQMQVDPRQCLYIGDQLFDIEAANAAGMTSCLLWQEWSPPTAGEQASLQIESYDELLQRILV